MDEPYYHTIHTREEFAMDNIITSRMCECTLSSFFVQVLRTTRTMNCFVTGTWKRDKNTAKIASHVTIPT
jgi:hypothetical protein